MAQKTRSPRARIRQQNESRDLLAPVSSTPTSYLIQLYRPACSESKHYMYGGIWRRADSSLQHDPPFWQHAWTMFHLTSTVLVLNVYTMYWSEVMSHISRLNLIFDTYTSKINFLLSSKTLSPSLIICFVIPIESGRPQLLLAMLMIPFFFEKTKSAIFKRFKNVRDMSLRDYTQVSSI